MENTIQRVLQDEEGFAFWKNMTFVVLFFTITPIVIGISLFSLFSLKPKTIKPTRKVLSAQKTTTVNSTKSGVRVYASLPSNLPAISAEAETADARSELIREYLRYYHSPLENYASYIVETSDKYGLDYRLLTAIAQQESNLCKLIPPNSHNCWGWGIHSEGTLKFSSYESAIDTVALGLKEEYLDKGYTTIEDIMAKYTPLSNGSWADGVNKFMNDIQNP